MDLEADNVRVAVTGAVYGAPSGTPLPTTATQAKNAAFRDLGYVSEEGVVQAIASNVNDIRAWQNGDLVRRVQTTHDLTYALTFLETQPETIEAYYGNYSSGDVQIVAEQGVRQAWIIDIVDGDDLIRIVIPDAQVTARDDISYVNGNAISYGITLTAYPDANGVKAFVYYATDGAS